MDYLIYYYELALNRYSAKETYSSGVICIMYYYYTYATMEEKGKVVSIMVTKVMEVN